MENITKNLVHKFGLVGKDISYSFSRGYFLNKFKTENLPHHYVNYDLQSIDELRNIIGQTSNLKGLNVTIPYKEKVIPLLDKLDDRSSKIGAVNTIKISKNKKLIGYNTDYYGFKNSLKPHLKKYHKRALILGTGGASKAIKYALKKLNIKFDFVSRSLKKETKFLYSDLTINIVSQYNIIINCTPIGTFPKIDKYPKIPYNGITDKHILYDLIYNPQETQFLKFGKKRGATTINGLEMLKLQAEESWKIWNAS